MARAANHPVLNIEYPDWVDSVVDWTRIYSSDEDRMRLAIDVSRSNVEHGTGGPFGAAIFEQSGKVIAVGMNSVVRYSNCILHGETMAMMMAQRVVNSFTLSAPHLPVHEMFTSCEPCAMCLGASLWSGVRRIVCGANRDDATRLSFEEGPVFPESYKYLEARGIKIEHALLRDEARAVLEMYRATGGKIYNA